jgi:hypothetical protein
MVRKWFNIKSKTEDFQADDVNHGGGYHYSLWILTRLMIVRTLGLILNVVMVFRMLWT